MNQSMNQGMKLSVLVPTYNRRELLEQKLASLAAQTLSEGAFEVIVCDDGSTDGTREWLAGMRVPFALCVLTPPQKLGAARARNLCAERAKGDVLLFSDDDCLLAPRALEEHLEAHARFPRSVVVGRLELPGALRNGSHREPFERTFSIGSRALWINATGANTSVPAWAFRQVGGYDPRFVGYGGEDPHLALKLRALGLGFRRAPRALAYHAARQLGGDYQKKAFAAGRAQWRVYELFREPLVGLMLGLHPLLLALKRPLFHPAVAGRIKNPLYHYERAYFEGACEERRRDTKRNPNHAH